MLIKTPNDISREAERLATSIYEVAQWGKTHPNNRRYASHSAGLIKLPPVFQSVAGSKYGDGLHNLVAMIRTLSDYDEEGARTRRPTLAELPARYNAYGGLPKMTGREIRKVHNWMLQVNFALRAAVLQQEEAAPTSGMERLSVAQRVFYRLYSGVNCRRAFVTHAPDNRYELKPLRYASEEAILAWIEQECVQKHLSGGVYGARPTSGEWDAYGLRGQTKTICADAEARISDISQRASHMDKQGLCQEADILDKRMQFMLDTIGRLGDMEGAICSRAGG